MSPNLGTSEPCADTSVASGCNCQGVTHTNGYCCGGVWQSAACVTAIASSGSSAVWKSRGLLSPYNTTKWNPGILADTPLNQALGLDGLPVRSKVCKTLAPNEAANLQTILDGCAPATVVQLQAGTYTVPSTVHVPSGVVLRGRASSGTGATVVVLANGQRGPVLAIGPVLAYDQVCYQGNFDAAVTLTADATKEQNKLSVGRSNKTFAAGDFALLDEVDDPNLVKIDSGMTGAFVRVAGSRISERVEIASVDSTTGTITLSTSLHWTFKKRSGAKISRVKFAVTKWAGIEHIWVKNGNGLEYPGRMAGGVDVSNAAYCWVKDVQTDGTLTGMHAALTGTYRCVVRDSHFHNAKVYGFGQDNYGIVLRCGAADNLVENNVARYMNKPILFNNSGGGNVVGYNYADNAWCLDNEAKGACQESSIDCHASYPHMELIEGNYAPHMGASTTHGNAGYLTFFRNYSSSQQAPNPIVWSLPSDPQYSNVTAIQFDATDNDMTVVGNVLGSTTNIALGVPPSLGTANVTVGYMVYDGMPSIFRLSNSTDISVTSLWWHGNFDTSNGKVMWNPTISTHDLPASLYYATKPAWWPSDKLWPWTGPDLTPMVGTLPAQAYGSAFNYNNTNDNPKCSKPDGNSYNCVSQ